jgi:hydroxymethylbilane synthase
MTHADPPIRISTRSSLLALWQAEWVAANLDEPTVQHRVVSKGDRLLNVALQGRTDQGFFTKEIEKALLDGDADLAVHSLKDLPTTLDPRLALVAVSERDTVEDVLLVHPDWVDETRYIPIRVGGIIGATSLRRRALLRHYSPDLEPALLRGNVPTRLDRLRQGDFAGILLARAGLRRLKAEVQGFVAYALAPEAWLPAPGQAALGIESMTGSAAGEIAARSLDHAPTHREVALERKLMARFEAGCHAPFAAWAVLTPNGRGEDDDEVTVRIGCETDESTWATAKVVTNVAQAEQAAMEGLEAAKRSPVAPAQASPCQPISSF